MKQSSLRPLVFLLFIMILIGFVKVFSLKPKVYEVEASDVLSGLAGSEVVDYAPSLVSDHWTLAGKLAQAEDALRKIKLSVGDKDITYQEERITNDNSGISLTRVTSKEPEKEIALALLNKITGDIKIVTVVKQGDQIISSPDFPIEIVERSNGIRWNKWNTQYKSPADYVVLKNAYPEVKKVAKVIKDKKGRKQTIYESQVDQFIYSPYSEDLHTTELVMAGQRQVKLTVQQALSELRRKGVKSLSFPGKLVADVGALRPEFFELLPIIEQTDMTEFMIDPKKTSERVLVIIGANPSTAFAKTGSSAGALGWVQYTSKTYNMIRKLYPEAGLMKDFSIGAPSHHNSMMAAILLHDYHLSGLVKHYGPSIAEDPRLEEYLAAEYNGGPARITASLNATLADKLSEWGIHLRDETKGYMVKLRKLREMNFIEGVGKISINPAT